MRALHRHRRRTKTAPPPEWAIAQGSRERREKKKVSPREVIRINNIRRIRMAYSWIRFYRVPLIMDLHASLVSLFVFDPRSFSYGKRNYRWLFGYTGQERLFKWMRNYGDSLMTVVFKICFGAFFYTLSIIIIIACFFSTWNLNRFLCDLKFQFNQDEEFRYNIRRLNPTRHFCHRRWFYSDRSHDDSPGRSTEITIVKVFTCASDLGGEKTRDNFFVKS